MDLSSSLTNITINAEGPLENFAWVIIGIHGPFFSVCCASTLILIMGSNCVPERKEDVHITIQQQQRD